MMSQIGTLSPGSQKALLIRLHAPVLMLLATVVLSQPGMAVPVTGTTHTDLVSGRILLIAV